MNVIKIDQVSKEFRLGQMVSFTRNIKNIIGKISGNLPPSPPLFKALDHISLNVKQGEVLGIIGGNGAGKSTLLKLISRIITPTEGRIEVKGNIAPLIEVGAGVHPELTGRENIYLNASILGITRSEIKQKISEIISFAELEDFIDTPVKRYSSGMKIRLAFSIAIFVDAEILIIDEVLAVGDLAFQRKCFDRLEKIIHKENKTVLLVSHNLRQVERICSRVILIDKGVIVRDGTPKEVCNYFYRANDEKIRKNIETEHKHTMVLGRHISSKEVEVLDAVIVNRDNDRIKNVEFGENITIVMRIDVKSPLIQPDFKIGINTTDFILVATNSSFGHLNIENVSAGVFELKCNIKQFPFLPGVYGLRLSVFAGKLGNLIFDGDNLYHFQVEAKNTKQSMLPGGGFFVVQADWKIEEAVLPEQN